MTVTLYKSTDSGAPVLRGLANSLLQVLDAILVDGYGAKSSQGWSKAFASLITSGTATGGSSTTLIDTATNFSTLVPPVTVGMQVFRTADGKNARVSSITTTTNPNDTLNFTAVSPITPTFANLDAYTVDNNLRAYRQPVGSSNGFYLRVADDGLSYSSATWARMRGYETMSDVDTGTGLFPTDLQCSTPAGSGGDGGSSPYGTYISKSSTVDSTARPWICIGNGKIFYIFIARASSWDAAPAYCFGDFVSYKTGDQYNTIIAGSPNSGYSTYNEFMQIMSSNSYSVQYAHYIARKSDQTGGSLKAGKFSDTLRGGGVGYIGYGIIPYPNPVSGGMSIAPIELIEYVGPAVSQQYDRGRLPGLWNILHAYHTYYDHGDTFSGYGALAGKTFEVVGCFVSTYTAAFCIETSNTW